MTNNTTKVPKEKNRSPVVALCGGVGGAKLALGLYRVLAPNNLTLVINTGDDFEHLGLFISPDIDTVTYTCLLYTSPSPRDVEESRMPSSA